MKILVFSDSHRIHSFMRRCIFAVKPDTIIHLGDYFDDGALMAVENPQIPLLQVPGNCDWRELQQGEAPVRCCAIGGVRLFLTHGHRQNVKQTLCQLLAEARNAGAQVALYGHTHSADCHRETDGLWVMNPGAGGFYSASAGLIEVNNGQVVCCKILRESDLEELE